MKLLLFTLALAGGALAQTNPQTGAATTVPALPPGATSAASTVSAASPAASVTLRFAPQPGTLLEYASVWRQTFQLSGARVVPRPNVRLTAALEKTRQALEARYQRDFAGSLPQLPPQAGKQFVKVLPPLADGSQVLLTTSVTAGPKGQPVTVRLRQTLGPDGQVQGEFLGSDSADPGMQKVQGALGSLVTQLQGSSGQLGGSDLRVFGQPLTVGQTLSRSDTLDLGQLLGGLLGSLERGASASGRLHLVSALTYQGQDAAGNARFASSARADDTSLSLHLTPSDTVQFSLRDLSVTGQASVRPDGLSGGSSGHTEGRMELSLGLPNQPFQLVVNLNFTQDISLTLK